MASEAGNEVEEYEEEEIEEVIVPRRPANLKASVFKVCGAALGGGVLGGALGYGKVIQEP